MESVSDGCPTGILIDIGLQTKALNNIKKNEENQVSIKSKKEKNTVADVNSSHSWTSNCILDQTPPKPPPILKKNVFFTPKSNWKTPSPKSMKIISRDASRIVNQLFSSPINCSEVMIYDEVFPAIKSLDDACFDELNVKSRSLPATDMTVAHEKVDQKNPNSFHLTKCPISAVSSCTSESEVVSDEKLSTIVLQSDMKPVKEQNSISEKILDGPENACNQDLCTAVSGKECPISAVSSCNSESGVVTDEKLSTIVLQSDMKPIKEHSISEKILDGPENACNQDLYTAASDKDCPISAVSSCTSESGVVSDERLSSIVLQSDMKPVKEHNSISEKIMDAPQNASSQDSCVESAVSDKETVKSVTCVGNYSPDIPECINESSDQLLASVHKVTIHKKLPALAKGFGFKKPMKHCAEKNKENEHQSNGTIQAKYGPRFSKTEKSCSSIENGTKETQTRKNQILKEESTVEQSSTKYITAKYSVLEKKKAKESQNLENHLIGKPKALQQKSNIGRSQSLLYKKDPLYKTETMLGTPIVESSIRRFRSFHDGSTKNSIPTVEKKFIPSTESCCRVLKPKLALNQASNNGNGFSTPLQFERYSQNLKLAGSTSANPMRRKSLAFNSNNSLVASGIKVATQKDHHSITKKPAVTSSSRLGFGKKLNMPSSHPKFKNDNLPRKLFP